MKRLVSVFMALMLAVPFLGVNAHAVLADDMAAPELMEEETTAPELEEPEDNNFTVESELDEPEMSLPLSDDGEYIRFAGTVYNLPDGGGEYIQFDGSVYIPPADSVDLDGITDKLTEINESQERINTVLSYFFVLSFFYIAIKAVMYVFTRVFFGGIN